MRALSRPVSQPTNTPAGIRRTVLTVFGLGSAALGAAAEAQIRFDDPRIFPRQFRTVALADFDGDGHLDAAVVERRVVDRIAILFNDGVGNLVEDFSIEFSILVSVTALMTGDVDGDGHVDLVWIVSPGSDRFHFLYNRGDGRGGERREIPIVGSIGSFRSPSILADLTGNGQLDVIYRPSGTAIKVLEHHARGEGVERALFETPPNSYLYAITAGDIDGDGDVDVAAVYGYDIWWQYSMDWSEMAALFLNQGRLVETTRLPLSLVNLPENIRAGDLDGDGDLDFVITAADLSYYGSYSNHAHVVTSEGRKLREGQVMQFGEGSTPGLELSDLDGDGRLDIAATSHDWGSTGRVWLHAMRGRGDATFEPLLDIPVMNGDVSRRAALALGDLHHGGRFDVAIASGRAGLAVLRNLSPIDGPDLAHGRIARRESATFTVIDAQPGERVHFLYSLSGAGHTRGQPLLGGIVLDLLDPIVHFGSATADANGTAILRVTVPRNAPLTTVVTQAVIRRGPGGADSVKTPFRTARIEE